MHRTPAGLRVRPEAGRARALQAGGAGAERAGEDRGRPASAGGLARHATAGAAAAEGPGGSRVQRLPQVKHTFLSYPFSSEAVS